MSMITDEQKRIITPDFEERILYLIEKIKKYHGKYNSKELKEWLTALLMLEIDLQNDTTYNEKMLKNINRIEFAQNIFNFNIYGSIRKFLEKNDGTLTFPGGGYNGDYYDYPVWHDRFIPADPKIPRGASDKIEVLKINTSDEHLKKTIITLTGPTIRSKKIRQLQIDKMIIKLYEQSLKKPEINFDPVIDNYYRMHLAPDIQILHDWICRCSEEVIAQPHGFYRTQIKDSIDEESQKINDYVNKLYKAFQNEYGQFKEPFRRPDEIIGKIDIDTKGTITETYPIKETPTATWKKRITHY